MQYVRAHYLFVFTKTLKRGVSGEEVRQLQQVLKTMPDSYPEGLVSGYFGPLTQKAVKRFQVKHGIEAIGIVGPKTRKKLNELSPKNSLSPPSPLSLPIPVPAPITVPLSPSPSSVAQQDQAELQEFSVWAKNHEISLQGIKRKINDLYYNKYDPQADNVA